MPWSGLVCRQGEGKYCGAQRLELKTGVKICVKRQNLRKNGSYLESRRWTFQGRGLLPHQEDSLPSEAGWRFVSGVLWGTSR